MLHVRLLGQYRYTECKLETPECRKKHRKNIALIFQFLPNPACHKYGYVIWYCMRLLLHEMNLQVGIKSN